MSYLICNKIHIGILQLDILKLIYVQIECTVKMYILHVIKNIVKIHLLYINKLCHTLQVFNSWY